MKAFKEWLEQFKIKCLYCNGTGVFRNGKGKFVVKHIELDEAWQAALEWIKDELVNCLCADEEYDAGLHELEQKIDEELEDE